MRALLLALTFPFAAIADEAPTALEVGNGWMAATQGGDARIYVRLHNEGTADLTLGAVTSDLGEAALVAPPLTGGDPVPLGPFPLDAGTELQMEPGAIHILIRDAGALAEGSAFTIDMAVEPGEAITIPVEVEGPDAESDSHVGHNH